MQSELTRLELAFRGLSDEDEEGEESGPDGDEGFGLGGDGDEEEGGEEDIGGIL